MTRARRLGRQTFSSLKNPNYRLTLRNGNEVLKSANAGGLADRVIKLTLPAGGYAIEVTLDPITADPAGYKLIVKES